MKKNTTNGNLNQPDVLTSDIITGEYFTCINCMKPVPLSAPGTRHRNHCPYCLWSMHLDIRPGDRAGLCNGRMQPLSIYSRDDKELSVIHRCVRCGKLKINRIAGDDDLSVMKIIAMKVLDELNEMRRYLHKG